jgi:hypothetical protein
MTVWCVCVWDVPSDAVACAGGCIAVFMQGKGMFTDEADEPPARPATGGFSAVSRSSLGRPAAADGGVYGRHGPATVRVTFCGCWRNCRPAVTPPLARTVAFYCAALFDLLRIRLCSVECCILLHCGGAGVVSFPAAFLLPCTAVAVTTPPSVSRVARAAW